MRALMLLLLLSTAAAQVPATVTGVPTVTDGDTLQIRGVKVRLHGIDAPESSQTCTRAGKVYGCGREAAFALADLVRNKTVTCTRKDTDRYSRMVGVCTVGGTEVNRWLVQQGWALPYLQYGGGIYSSAASVAKEAKKGLYAGTFQNPWDYRRNPSSPATAGTPRPATAPSSVPAGADVYYANCTAARAAGAAPIRVGQPGYRPALDRDKDGIACE
ncbi:excalibur calcium-binding domain-containing protein [Deinococcus actinosclerus]|uniref:Nuclease n=1 Tax=Deinococcus actinosclerus TaxID=1768108 RepID=A0ABM5X321_9DEIO|nr:excalibur calcium-binding domain-containing protein [Deinococcus actinosclerus]ALW87875.1 nuclease [Deinococcus actinosclerus]